MAWGGHFSFRPTGHLPAWLPVAKRPEASMLLYHLGQRHPDQVGPYLERMRTECIATVVVEEDETR